MTTTTKTDSITLAEVYRLSDSLTDEQIRLFEAEAGAAGDTHMVRTCRFALDGLPSFRRQVAKSMLTARAMRD